MIHHEVGGIEQKLGGSAAHQKDVEHGLVFTHLFILPLATSLRILFVCEEMELVLLQGKEP